MNEKTSQGWDDDGLVTSGKSIRSDILALRGIELMHMLRKGQLGGDEFEGLSATEQFYALAS